MDFESARKQFERLSRLFQSGEIDAEEFTKGVDKLSVTDQGGKEWMIGMQSGKWYRKTGSDWVEDDPLKESGDPAELDKQTRRRRAILLIAILILVVLCVGTWYFGIPGLVPKQYDLGLVGGRDTQETQPVSQATSASQTVDISAETPDSSGGTPETTLTATASGNQPDESEETATITPEPTVTMTPTPPSPIATPETWQLRSALNLQEKFPLNQDWEKIPDKPWEYEFLYYEDQYSLLVQFMETDVLWHANANEVEDVERTLTMAIPDMEGAVTLICLWQTDLVSGYKIWLSNQAWQFIQVINGSETVLEEGTQTPEFDIGDYATFVHRCKEDRIEFWREGEKLVDYEDPVFETGAVGLGFEIDVGIGLAFFTSDQVWAIAPEDELASVGDRVRVADVDIWLVAVKGDYGEMVENRYEGQDLIGFDLRIANNGTIPIEIIPQNLILREINRDVRALDFAPQIAVDSQLFPFGEVTGVALGEVFFAGVNPDELENWTLVVDLRYQGYGEVIFEFLEE